VSGLTHSAITPLRASFRTHFGQPLERIREVGAWPTPDTALKFSLLCLTEGCLDEADGIVLDKFAIGRFVFMVAADFEDPV
jgi:hypothetical protein